jgi:excisionase family DNA binding protein
LTTDQKVRGSNPFERAEVSQHLYGNYHFGYCYLRYQLAKQLAKVFLGCGKLGLLYAILIRGLSPACGTLGMARLTATRRPIRWTGRSKNALVEIWKFAPPSSTSKRRNMTTQLLYTVEQAAQALAISRSSLYRLIVSKEIVTIGIGRSRRVSHQALEGFIKAKTKSEYASW